MKRVAILGGGMAGLAAAWRLSGPDAPPAEVTVYQRGARLGGKGASSRGPHGRIEEHGLHVWLGYYDNAFRLLRACYEELDRSATDPACPIQTWRDAFLPASLVGLGGDDADGWHDWLAWFPENDKVPGDPPTGDDGLDVFDLARHLLALVGRFGGSLDPSVGLDRPRAVLTVSPTPPAPATSVTDLARGIGVALRAIGNGGLAADRSARFLELVVAMLRGILADGLLVRGFGAVDDVDLCDWLRSHGASEAALHSPFVRGSYDLAFAYERGDLARPAISAGTGLLLTGRMFLAYKGAMFWKMRAGMGDVVFAPIYEALRRRGVRFEFFHRLDGVHPSADGSRIDAVTLGRQVALQPGVDQYDPLVRIHDLPVFPDRVDLDQVEGPPEIERQPFEQLACTWSDVEARKLRAGVDFDHLVLAVSLGIVPIVAPAVVAARPEWQRMVEHVGTVPTQAMQLWLTKDERELGWHRPAATVTGCGAPMDTYASLSHTIPFEDWPATEPARTSASFCAVFDDRGVADPDAAVRAGAATFLHERIHQLWPTAVDADGIFRWELLAGATGTGEDRLASQHLRANVDPSDRYVQSLPGSAAHRLRADESGYDNLVLAGDWIETGLNAGCIEAATLGGIQAANAVLGRPLDDGTSGFRPRARAHV